MRLGLKLSPIINMRGDVYYALKSILLPRQRLLYKDIKISWASQEMNILPFCKEHRLSDHLNILNHNSLLQSK